MKRTRPGKTPIDILNCHAFIHGQGCIEIPGKLVELLGEASAPQSCHLIPLEAGVIGPRHVKSRNWQAVEGPDFETESKEPDEPFSQTLIVDILLTKCSKIFSI